MAKGVKTGGRKPGSVNKSNAEVKAALAAFTSDNIDQLTIWLSQVEDPSKRIDLFLKALEYTMPKLARSEVAVEEAVKTTHVHIWSDVEQPADS